MCRMKSSRCTNLPARIVDLACEALQMVSIARNKRNAIALLGKQAASENGSVHICRLSGMDSRSSGPGT